MRVTEVEHELIALLLCTVTNTDDLELLGVTLGYTDNHVVDKGTAEAVKSSTFLLVVFASNENFVAFNLNCNRRADLLGELSELALYGYEIVFTNGNSNTGGKNDGLSAYS